MNEDQATTIAKFKQDWLDTEEVSDEETIDNIIDAIVKGWSGLKPDFLLEPILQILLERQSELQNDNLETIQQKLIKSLSLKKSQDDNFNNKLEEYLKTNAVNAKNHPLLFRSSQDHDQANRTQQTPLLFYVV